jgi:hypothetical protein
MHFAEEKTKISSKNPKKNTPSQGGTFMLSLPLFSNTNDL